MSPTSRAASHSGEVLELTRMTKKSIRALCKKNKLYQTPELNDVLYLHYQGYRDIECLEEYTGLKCLWLENNAISDIQGLDHQTMLRCLFLNHNLIKKIENLETCRELDTLNLANNQISRIENCGVDKLPVLSTLNLSHNYLRMAADIEEVVNCKMVSVLDLSHNRIDDILVVKIFAQMPELRVLDLDGNPVVNKIPQYRKTLILECKSLNHLDRRPVFPRDRACAEAWKRGGYEEERREHARWNKAERRKIRESVNATLRLRNRGGGDPQFDYIGSSSEEDEIERSSAPVLDKNTKNLQCIKNTETNSNATQKPEGENRKCKVCERVDCKYEHIAKDKISTDTDESVEDIMEDSVNLLYAEYQKGLNTEARIVNITQIGQMSRDSELTAQAYQCYLNTLDNCLKTSTISSQENIARESEFAISAQPESDGSVVETSKTPNSTDSEFIEKICEIQLNCTESENQPDHDAKTSSPDETASLKLSINQTLSNTILGDDYNEIFDKTPDKSISTCKHVETNSCLRKGPKSASEIKKQVKLLVCSEIVEEHLKIRTTPIPNRKGRKIEWNRDQQTNKRSKRDRGKTIDDALDIFDDWYPNPLKNDVEVLENLKDADPTLSSTLIEYATQLASGSDENVFSPILRRNCTNENQLLLENSQTEMVINQSEGSGLEITKDTGDGSSSGVSIIVHSYDAFLKSMESKLQASNIHDDVPESKTFVEDLATTDRSMDVSEQPKVTFPDDGVVNVQKDDVNRVGSNQPLELSSSKYDTMNQKAEIYDTAQCSDKIAFQDTKEFPEFTENSKAFDTNKTTGDMQRSSESLFSIDDILEIDCEETFFECSSELQDICSSDKSTNTESITNDTGNWSADMQIRRSAHEQIVELTLPNLKNNGDDSFSSPSEGGRTIGCESADSWLNSSPDVSPQKENCNDSGNVLYPNSSNGYSGNTTICWYADDELPGKDSDNRNEVESIEGHIQAMNDDQEDSESHPIDSNRNTI